MSSSQLASEPKRPEREPLGIEIAITLSAILLFVSLLAAGIWILYWALKPAPIELENIDEDPIVQQYRRVGLEIQRNSEGNIRTITTPNPLLVTDKDLALVTGLPELYALDLRDTQITDAALMHLTDLPMIEKIFVGGSIRTDAEPTLFHSRFTDAGVDPLSKLTSLKILSLAKTDIGDAAVAKLPNLTNLQELYLIGTNVTDASVASLSKMTHLKELHLQETAVSEAALEKLRAALPDTKVFPEAGQPVQDDPDNSERLRL